MGYQTKDLSPGMVILCVPPAHEPVWDRLLDFGISWSSGPFTHAALVGHGELVEQLLTVQTSPLSKYAYNGWTYRIQGLTPTRAAAMILCARQHLGQPYGIKAILEDGLIFDVHDWRLMTAPRPRLVTCSGFVERATRCGAGLSLTHMPLPSTRRR